MEKKTNRKKIKLKKEVLWFLITILIIIIILINIFKSRSYEVEYKVNDYDIIENYNKKEKLYTFVIKNEETSYTVYSNLKYNKKHKLIKEIEKLEIEEEKCLLVIGNDISFNPLCSVNNEEVDYRLTSDEMLEKLKYKKDDQTTELTYNNKTIYNTLGYTFLFWNYKGFDVINEKNNTISLCSTDQYEIPIAAKINNYILIADYNDKYTFSKFFIYDIEKGTKDEMVLDYEISYESYILGTYDKSIYLVDKVNKVEYEIVPHKQKIRIVGTSYKRGTIYTDKGFESISIEKLISDELSFKSDNKFDYKVENSTLYQYTGNSKLKVSNQIIKEVLRIENDSVLYLVEDTLYLYNLEYGEVKIANNFEWNFNYKNLIFLYIP